jgi:hypothetical protein
MSECNGYNVSDDGYNVTEPPFEARYLAFRDIYDRKQTSTVKVNGECIRVPDEIKYFFEFLGTNDPALAALIVRRYKMVRQFLDFERSLVESGINSSVAQKGIEYLHIVLGHQLNGKYCYVTIYPVVNLDAPKKFQYRIGFSITMTGSSTLRI